jgi:hypothetical protein
MALESIAVYCHNGDLKPGDKVSKKHNITLMNELVYLYQSLPSLLTF